MELRTWIRAEWDRIAGFGLVGLGGVLLILGYHGVSTSPFVAQQISYAVSGGMGGLFLLGAGVGLLISADLHDEWRKLDRIEMALRGEAAPDPKRLIELLRQRANGDGPAPMPPEAGPVPDRAHERPRAHVALAGGGAAIGILTWGWLRAAHTADLETAWTGLALAGLALAVALAVAGGRSYRLRRFVVGRTRVILGPAFEAVTITAAPSGSAAAIDPATVFVVPGLRRFHRSGCPALAGAGATPEPTARAEVAPGLEPCKLCGAS